MFRTTEHGVHKRRSKRWVALLPVAAMTLSMGVSLPVAAVAQEASTSFSSFVNAQAADSGSAFAQALESKYVDPDRVFSTDVRWWIGDASHTDDTIREQIQHLYDAGFRGVELCMQNDPGAPDDVYAYGTDQWEHKWELMMNELLDLGMSVYLTSGTNWATSNVPGLDPTSQAAMQNLTMGTAEIAANESISALPQPAENSMRAGAELVSAYAYRVVEGDTVDPDSYIDLSTIVASSPEGWDQKIDWTAPEDGPYRVFGIWTQGTYQTSDPSAELAYTTNYFDERGVEALKDFWEHHLLSDAELAAKIKEGDVQLFMDSLEIHPGGGSEFEGSVAQSDQFTFWAEDMAEQFEQRKGYDITPYLFLLRGTKANVYDPYHGVHKTGVYKLDGDEDLRERVINDFQDVQTQLYRERMLRPMKKWLNSVGIETRAQISYGKPLEISEPAMDVDYPEAENFNQYNQVDILRLWTGGAKLENKVLSTETGAQMPAYNGTVQNNLRDAYSQFAAGFQRIVWHVWAADYGYGNYDWPGYVPFAFGDYVLTGMFRYLGDSNPDIRDYDELNAHLGRVQQLLQTGESRTDIGFVNQNWFQGVRFGGGTGDDNSAMNWQQAHQGVYYRSTELQDNGYTYDYFSPDFLFDDDVSFDPETQTIEKAGYKAVVLYQSWLDFDGAKRILDWAEQGLKVVILEDAASQTPFNDGGDDELAAVITELKGLDTVRQAHVADMPEGGYFSSDPGGYDDDILEQLQDLGVEPYSGFPEPNLQLLTQTRQDADGNQYVFAYNYDDGSYLDKSHKESVRNAEVGDSIQTEIVQDGEFVPYEIDPWTGEVTQLADYRWEDGKTVVPVDINYNDIGLLAFDKVDEAPVHVVSTNASSTYATTQGVVARAGETGIIETELSDGTLHSDEVEVPKPFDITDWNVTIDSWLPNDEAGDLVRTETVNGVETVNRKTSTKIDQIDVQLDTLKPWDEIDEVGKAVSGTGHYEATFGWDASTATGAYLDFGRDFVSTMEVWINGRKVGGDVSTNPSKVRKDVGGTVGDGRGGQIDLVGEDLYTGGIDWSTPRADISDYLVDGENEIVIDYSSVLSNVQIDRGVVAEGRNHNDWWGFHTQYLSFGPQQAKILPFVELAYSSDAVDPAIDIAASATPKAVDGEVVLDVVVTNGNEVPVDVTVETPFGESDAVTTLASDAVTIDPGETVTISVNTGESEIPAGEAMVEATAVIDDVTVTASATAPYDAFAIDGSTGPGGGDGPGDSDGSGDEGSGDGDLATTGGSIAIGILVVAALLLAGGLVLVRVRRRAAAAGVEDDGEA
ncbi:glycosyl hydrolase [Microbacterium sp.]|uniref:glycosyl hydrolase n=1 Tax=Microbacterium sp. TaxID=51671 RepID=UPI00262DE32A|nr:glycosyl hydrolase [Microbacterium sp.]